MKWTIAVIYIYITFFIEGEAFMVKCSQNKHNPLLRGTKDKADYRNNLEPEIKETSNSLPSKQESDINAFRPLRVPPSAFETDFLGMINFCLRNVDNTLSGPSRSKVLNEISNDVFKAIVIGYAPLIADVVVKFPVYKTMIERTECKLDRGLNSDTGDTVIIDNCDLDLQVSLIYMNWLQDLIERGVAHENVLGGIYDRGYKRLLTYLRDSSCVFQASTATPSLPGAAHSPQPPKPTDRNICLSIMDARRGTSTPNYTSKTTELNHLANVVGRAMLYGGQREKHRVAEGLHQHANDFADRWGLPASDAQYGGSQEVNFIQVMAVLLTRGLAAAETVSSYNPDAPPGTSLRLHDVYQNAFHRVVEMCLLDSKADYSPLQSDEIWLNFLDWEQGIRRDLTQELWKQNPAELVGEWELVDVSGLGSLNSIMTAPAEMFFTDTAPGTIVEFIKDGKVRLKHSQSEGINWCFRPGPAHLDTCEFYVQSGTKADLMLKYVGFIDRGQRIESRFSKLPIRMTGRVLSLVRGLPQGSCRFVMNLRRK